MLLLVGTFTSLSTIKASVPRLGLCLLMAFIDTTAMVSASHESRKGLELEKESKAKLGSGALGFLTKRDQADQEARNAEVDAAEAAYTKRVLDDPDTEWVDWDDVKRDLADKHDWKGRQRDQSTSSERPAACRSRSGFSAEATLPGKAARGKGTASGGLGRATTGFSVVAQFEHSRVLRA